MVDFSVILATKNEGKYIGKTLRNILEASDEVERHGVSTEIIVVDSSTDDTFGEARNLVENVYTFLPSGVSRARVGSVPMEYVEKRNMLSTSQVVVGACVWFH